MREFAPLKLASLLAVFFPMLALPLALVLAGPSAAWAAGSSRSGPSPSAVGAARCPYVPVRLVVAASGGPVAATAVRRERGTIDPWANNPRPSPGSPVLAFVECDFSGQRSPTPGKFGTVSDFWVRVSAPIHDATRAFSRMLSSENAAIGPNSHTVSISRTGERAFALPLAWSDEVPIMYVLASDRILVLSLRPTYGSSEPPSGRTWAAMRGLARAIIAALSPPRPPARSPAPGSGRTEVSRALPGPGQVKFTLASISKALALTVFLVLLVGFPAEIFNRTLEDNYEEVQRWLGRLRPPARLTGRVRLRPSVQMAVFTVIAAVMCSLVDPELTHRESGWEGKGLLLLIGFAVAIPLTTLAFAGPAEVYARRITKQKAALRVLPFALVVAALFVFMSQAGHFLPGYVYGLIAGYGAVEGRRLTVAQGGRAVLRGAAIVLAAALLAWVIWEPIRLRADAAHASAPILVLDSVLSLIVVLGLQAIVFGLLPMRFLAGGDLRRWNLWAWVAVYGIGMFFFVMLLVLDNRPLADKAQQLHAVITVVALFGAFAVFSTAFWIYFRRRPEEPEEEEHVEPEDAEAKPAEKEHPEPARVPAQGSAPHGEPGLEVPAAARPAVAGSATEQEANTLTGPNTDPDTAERP